MDSPANSVLEWLPPSWQFLIGAGLMIVTVIGAVWGYRRKDRQGHPERATAAVLGGTLASRTQADQLIAAITQHAAAVKEMQLHRLAAELAALTAEMRAQRTQIAAHAQEAELDERFKRLEELIVEMQRRSSPRK